MDRLTTQEAKSLINQLKRIAESEIEFPEPGSRKEIMAEDLIQGDDKYVITICPGAMNPEKCTFQARIKMGNIVLLRLDICSNEKAHKNPDGTIIYGSHLHVYNEINGDKEAIKFDKTDKRLTDDCLEFLEKFNVVEPANILIKPNLFN